MLTNNLVARSMVLAAHLHKGQYRKYSNAFGLKEPYINHPARVAAAIPTQFVLPVDEEESLQLAGRMNELIAAAWCHDILEDCDIDYHTLVNTTSPACAALVQELTNPSKNHLHLRREERKAIDRDHIRHISDDAKLIKMLDRIDNIRGIVDAPRDFALLYLRESKLLAECLTGVNTHVHNQLIGIVELAENFFDRQGKTY